jgi:SAM-dependent methyltransferase
MIGRELKCPVCGGRRLHRCGAPRYRPDSRVAGVPIRIDDLRLSHHRCDDCTFQFVWPAIPRERLLACYENASGKNWSTSGKHAEVRGYALKRRLLEQFATGKRVLDFGCFDGGFLDYLPEGWERFGIEPSTQAAEIARGRGVRILASTVDSVPSEFLGTMNAIIVFDVMEHLTDPVEALRALKGLLAPGGIILIETGDCNSSHWRLIGRDYPYCSIVEHVGFFNKQSIATAGRRAGLTSAHFRRSIHDAGPSIGAWLRVAAEVIGYYAFRLLRFMGVRLPPRYDAIARGGSPAGFEWYDHFLAVLRRGD